MIQTKQSFNLSAGDRIGRFAIVRHLGAGGMGSVYLAADGARGGNVALKIIPLSPNIDPKQEFALLATLDHPNIVRVRDIDAAVIDGRPVGLIAMDYIDGQHADTAVKAEDEPDAYLEIARQLLGALACLHARGIVHGDIKPGNLLVVRDGDGPRAVLVDFGLATGVSPARRGYAGTPLYSAPELFGGAQPDALTDLFSAGVLLFELAAGCLPFTGDDTAQRLSALLAGQHADILELAPFLPLGMDELINGLLQHSPSARLQSADEALGLLAECMGEDSADVRRARHVLQARPPLAERRQALDLAYRRILQAGDSPPPVTLLYGEGGTGKTRILQEVSLQLALRDHGRIHCDLKETQRATPPLQRAVAAHIRSRADRFSAIISRFGPGVRAFAGLADSAGVDDIADAAQTRAFVFSEVARLLSDLSAAEPVTLLVDDLEALGDSDADLLRALLFTRFSGRVSALLAGDDRYMPPGVKDLVTLAEHRGILESCRLEALTPKGCETLVTGVLGDGDWTALARRLAHTSAGNPGAMIGALQQCVHNDLLLRRRGRWEYSPDFDAAKDAIPAAAGEDEAALQRAGDRAPHLLLACLMPAPLGEKLYVRAAELLALDAPAASLALLTRDGLLHVDDDGGYAFVQPALRSLLEETMDSQTADRMGNVLLDCAEDDDNPAVAAWIARRAGDDARAIPLLTAQGKRALEAGNPEEARALAQAALDRGKDNSQWADHTAMARRICSESLLRLGRAPAAVTLMEPAMTDAPLPEDRALLLEALRMNSAHSRGVEIMQQAEDAGLLGDDAWDRDPAVTRRLFYAGNWCRMLTGGKQQVLSDVSDLLKRRGHQLTGARRARLLILKGSAAGMCNRPEEAVAAFTEARGLFQRLGDLKGIGDAFNGLGTVSMRKGDFQAAGAQYQQALNYFKDIGNFDAITRAFNNLANAFYMQGNWEEAGKLWEVFLTHCRQSGNLVEQLRAYNNLGFLYLNTGQLGRSRRHLEEGLRLSELTGNRGVRLTLLSNLGEVLARQDETQQAHECYEEAAQLCEELGALGEKLELLHRVASLHIRQGRLRAAQESIAALLAGAEKHQSPGETAWGLRLNALVLLEENPHQAADAAARSVELFMEAQEPFEAARSRGTLARALFALGSDQQAREELDAARQQFMAVGARGELEELGRISASVGRRTGWSGAGDGGSVLVDTVRNLISERDTDRLLDRVLSHALDATGAGRGAILIRSGHGDDLRVRAAKDIGGQRVPGDAMAVSTTAVKKVFDSGEALAVVNVDEAADELRGSESILDLNLHSLLVVPLEGLDRRLGVLYLDSEHLGEQRMTAQLSLLSALASVASVAIETAMLLEERRRHQEELGVIAHELRAPLHGIRGMASLLAGGDTLAEADRHKVQTIVGQADRMGRMVQDLLQASLLDPAASGAAPPMTAVALAPVLREVAQMVAAANPEGDDRIRLKITEELTVTGHRDRLVQAITNLATNALKYSPEDAAVDIRLAPASKTLLRQAGMDAHEHGSVVLVEVADRGDGIDDEAKKTIFQRFVRLPDGRLKASGAGLGLYIAHRIAGQHQGAIAVLDRKGGGTRFCLLLPGGVVAMGKPQAVPSRVGINQRG